MIQFNLLPDVKLEYIKTRRRKRTISTITTLVTAASVGLLVLTFFIANVAQKVRLNGLDKDIKANSKKLQEMPDVEKVLTIQNQLNSLPGLHAKKPVASRLFGYMSQLTPNEVNVSQMEVNFDDHIMNITGGADKLETVNKFIDTLKFSDYTTTASPEPRKAFSNVTLNSFGRDDKGANYVVQLQFDEAIFNSASEGIALIVPKIITTRSETERPAALFVAPTPAPTPGGTR